MTQSRKPASRTTTTRKAPAIRAVDVDTDLTAEEIEKDDPYVARLPSGATIRLHNVADLDWQVAARLDPRRAFDFFETVVLEEDYETFIAEKGLTGKHLNRIMRGYYTKFREELGEFDA